MSKLGPICTAEIIQSKLFDYQSFMSDPRLCKRKIVSDLGSTEGYYIGLDAKGNAHYLFTLLLVHSTLIPHLWSWSGLTRVRLEETNEPGNQR